jgi:hypothetical protein
MAVIDTHTHYFPEDWVGLVKRERSAHGATIEKREKGAVTFAFPDIKPVFARGFPHRHD